MKIILLFILCMNIYPQTATVEIKIGTHILPNGKYATDEWDDATEFKVEGEFILLLKQDDQYFYMGIKFLKETHTGIDLYLAESDTNMKMLHVSSALGEKEFFNGEWSDFIWGENDLWMANSIGMISENGKAKFLESEGFEFQIHKSSFKDKKWFLMIHLKRPEIFFPSNTANNSVWNWLQIIF